MLTGKQRAYLRSLAQREEPILYIGKAGVTEAIVTETENALTARELVKGKVLETSPVTPAEAQAVLCARCECDGVQVIGRVFSIYRKSAKEAKIELPK